MSTPDKIRLELARISKALSRSIHYSTNPEDSQKIVRKTIRDIDNLIKQLDTAPVKTGKKGTSAGPTSSS